MRHFIFYRLLLITFITCSFINVFAEKKVALVWGNSQYGAEWSSLPVCFDDATAINQKLKSLGFTTLLVTNCNQDEMRRSLKEFATLAKNSDVAVFFYSGHGLRIKNNYFLVPAKTELSKINGLASEYFPVDDIIRTLQNNSLLSILFFDSCRNGFTIDGQFKGKESNSYQSATNIGGRYANGKANGCMICYATEMGEKASTGNGKYSPFTTSLLNHLSDGDEFRTTWMTIEKEVVIATNNQQSPISERSYANSFFFNPSGKKLADQNFVSTNEETKQDQAKKSITFTTNAPNAIIDFYGEKFEVGKPLSYKIGASYIYTIEAEGYEPFSGKLEVTNATSAKQYVELKAIQHTKLKLTSSPNADVFLDGKKIGRTPLNVETSTGKHSLGLYQKGYYDYHSQIDITPGDNTKNVYLTKKTVWFWDIDNDYEGKLSIAYTYSPKYQIGLDCLYRLENSRFSIGLRFLFSPSLFRGMGTQVATYAESTATATASVAENDVNTISVTKTTKTKTGLPPEYSEDIDPYHEAKWYESNAITLANVGYNICNGLMIEAGVGAAHNSTKIHMPCNYTISETVTTDNTTGQQIGETEYKYTRNEGGYWYEQDSKWSPVVRLGLRTFVPLSSKTVFINIGGGYSYLFLNHKFSSWDALIGVTFKL